jgi:hypothetical protein
LGGNIQNRKDDTASVTMIVMNNLSVIDNIISSIGIIGLCDMYGRNRYSKRNSNESAEIMKA